jgi:hypothetical protein
MRTLLADPIVDWSALGKVVLYSVVAGVGVPAVYGFAVLGAARSTDAARDRRNGAATAYALLALLGGAACVAAIVFGIVVLTQKS